MWEWMWKMANQKLDERPVELFYYIYKIILIASGRWEFLEVDQSVNNLKYHLQMKLRTWNQSTGDWYGKVVGNDQCSPKKKIEEC